MPADVWVDGDGQAKLIILAVEVVEVVAPQVLYVAWVDPAMAVGHLFDEHHRRQVVQVPACGDFDQTRHRPRLERLHPSGWRLRVIDLGDGVPGSKVVGQAVVVREIMLFSGSAKLNKPGIHRTR